MFIIDPLYTLPLIIGLCLTLLRRGRPRRPNLIGIGLSSLYLIWSVVAQHEVRQVVAASAQAQGVAPHRILITPTAFNTFFWRVVIMRDNHFDEGFYALVDRWRGHSPAIRFQSYERGADLDRATANFSSANEIRSFSRGFYRLSRNNDLIRITDLRMGQEPYYVFRFVFARDTDKGVEPATVTTDANRANLPLMPYLRWIGQGIIGAPDRQPRP